MITEIDEAITTLENTNRALVEANETAAKMKDLANRDSLTGVRNRTSYDAEAKTIDDDLKDGPLAFGIIMVDLNYLKKMNDTYGHDLGNVSLRTICDLICTVFANSDVFRIGGDEFVVILRDEDYQNHKELLAELDRRLQQIQSDDSLDEWQKVSAAVGVAIYDSEQDEGVESVFKRADMRMYENKKRMKALRQ